MYRRLTLFAPCTKRELNRCIAFKLAGVAPITSAHGSRVTYLEPGSLAILGYETRPPNRRPMWHVRRTLLRDTPRPK